MYNRAVANVPGWIYNVQQYLRTYHPSQNTAPIEASAASLNSIAATLLQDIAELNCKDQHPANRLPQPAAAPNILRWAADRLKAREERRQRRREAKELLITGTVHVVFDGEYDTAVGARIDGALQLYEEGAKGSDELPVWLDNFELV